MTTGIIGIIIFLAFVCTGLPIALSLFLVGLGGLLLLVGLEPTLATSAPMLYNYIVNMSFLSFRCSY